jgi:L-rhamnose mutarotase
MTRVGFTFKVRSENIEEYKRHQDVLWPALREALSRHGWKNYSQFMQSDGQVFAYFETPDSFQAAFEGISTEVINSRWQELMTPFLEPIDEDSPDLNMIELEEVFHLE